MRYLLCIILPPAAVFSTGRMGTFVLNIILTLLGWLPGIIHAMLVVSDYKADKRTDRVVQAMQKSQAGA